MGQAGHARQAGRYERLNPRRLKNKYKESADGREKGPTGTGRASKSNAAPALSFILEPKRVWRP